MHTFSALGLVALMAGPPHGFDDDVAFLRQHTQVVVLGESTGARVGSGRVCQSSLDRLHGGLPRPPGPR
jgi:hypothetical protein